jgi:hypothetical protein
MSAIESTETVTNSKLEIMYDVHNLLSNINNGVQLFNISEITKEKLLNIVKILKVICGEKIIKVMFLSHLELSDDDLDEILTHMPYCYKLDISHNKLTTIPTKKYDSTSNVVDLMVYDNTCSTKIQYTESFPKLLNIITNITSHYISFRISNPNVSFGGIITNFGEKSSLLQYSDYSKYIDDIDLLKPIIDKVINQPKVEIIDKNITDNKTWMMVPGSKDKLSFKERIEMPNSMFGISPDLVFCSANPFVCKQLTIEKQESDKSSNRILINGEYVDSQCSLKYADFVKILYKTLTEKKLKFKYEIARKYGSQLFEYDIENNIETKLICIN